MSSGSTSALVGNAPNLLVPPNLSHQQQSCAAFGNTFPPNNLIAEKNRVIGTLLPFLPEWLVMSTLRQSIVDAVYPAAGRSELVLAFLLEQLYGPTSKAQIVARYRCVVEPFTAPAPKIPVLIVEADNDPLVEKVLREQLKTTYPSAVVKNLGNVGHFAYLNEAATYTRLLEEFFRTGAVSASRIQLTAAGDWLMM